MRDLHAYLPRASNEIVSWFPSARQFTYKIPSTERETVTAIILDFHHNIPNACMPHASSMRHFCHSLLTATLQGVTALNAILLILEPSKYSASGPVSKQGLHAMFH